MATSRLILDVVVGAVSETSSSRAVTFVVWG